MALTVSAFRRWPVAHHAPTDVRATPIRRKTPARQWRQADGWSYPGLASLPGQASPPWRRFSFPGGDSPAPEALVAGIQSTLGRAAGNQP